MSDDKIITPLALSSMPSIAVRTLAKQTREYAEYLERQADLIAQQEQNYRNMRNYRVDFTKLLLKVERLVKNGETIDNAMVDVAKEYNVSLIDLKAFRPRLVAKRRIKEKARRNETILKMARRGLNDTQIAKRVGLHPKTVATIRRRAFEL